MIEVRDLTKWYGPTLAVDHVSFDVPKGEVLGFLGPNGAGKTTTMRILTCYIPASGGSARVAGSDVSTQTVDVRRRIGYLPESAPLYLDLGVIDFLEFIAHVRGFRGQDAQRRITKMVGTCGLGNVLHKSIGELSKGYRQRVGLAQALIHDPSVLLLDEPTTGLDPNQIIEIRSLIKSLGREKTVVLSTHILPEVEATCDRVQIINHGKLVASGTPDELATKARGETQIWLTVKASPADAEEGLRMLDGVLAIQLEEEKPDRTRYSLATAGNENIEEQIFKLATQRHWILTELRRETVSLEEIFLRLTTQESDRSTADSASAAS
ncbi:MAG: ATP-binding cassette domain-containing protein [Candidatus Eisenbacteria bacterium]|uniref:ATP-binding cassette domain-containing protein n=1 Tax=Eiseniibacteriota bacterium TaxID=2212470 RepID=A0A948RWS3_UNCEI|nr:ATP-binding cassette domain-containing protein [Candidatus Eisenbacteria bacterium]MBU2690977.1 ATP-binding cassette domain-containing protein [Candidatus Eisenbacteria bacterium]